MKARMARLKRSGKRLGDGWASNRRAKRKGRRHKTRKSGFTI